MYLDGDLPNQNPKYASISQTLILCRGKGEGKEGQGKDER